MDRASRHVLIGADVGATTIAAGIVTEAGEVVASERVATHGRGPGTATTALLALIDTLLAAAGRDGWSADAIGIGLPGIVDADRGMMTGAEGLVAEFAGVPLASNLQASTGLPVFVDNDANALALGEVEFGVARGAASMALLAIGTGVGGAIVLGGEVLRGHSGCAGEFGHVSIDFQGPPCRCGGRGCLNDYLSGTTLAKAARDAVMRGEPSKVLTLAGGDPERITAPLIFSAAAAGDELAGALVDRACTALGAGIGAIVNAIDPELVVVTGGVAASLVAYEQRIAEALRQYALPQAVARARVRIVPADKRRTVLGGAALARVGLRKAPRLVVSGMPTGSGEESTGRP